MAEKKPWIVGPTIPDFIEGITDNAPDSNKALQGYATIVAGYLVFKGQKKKK